MDNELFDSVVCVPQAESVPLHTEPDCVTGVIESPPILTQLLTKQPIASLGLDEDTIRVIPDERHTEDDQEGPAGLKIQGVSGNNSFSDSVTKSTPENPVYRSATQTMSSSTEAGGVPYSVPLQNVDPEMAKSILGQLVQVLQQAGQLPEDKAFQHLVKITSSNVTVKVAPSKTEKTLKHATSKRTQKVVQSPAPKSRRRKSRAAVENDQESEFTGVRRKRAPRRSKVNHAEDVDMLNMAETSISPVAARSEVNDYSSEEQTLSGESRDKYSLPPCEVRLSKLAIKRDARGRVIVPKSLLEHRKIDVGKYLDVKYLKPRSKKKSGETASSASVFISGKSSGFPDSIKVHLLPNMNEARDHAVRTMYMGPTEDVMQWLTVVWWRNSHFFCQCVFCPLLAESPKTIVRHLREDHPELSFALNKKELLGKSFLFINCRHCDFVTVDPVILWIHLELHHGISGILDGGLHPDINFSVTLELDEISGGDVISSPSSYVCFDCFRVSANSKALALHVLQEHADTLNYNGCFVKLMMIQKPNDRANVTYNQVISDAELACCRWDVFICMLCDLCVKCSYTVLSHTLSSHQNRHVLFTCPECSYNTVGDDRMIVHLTDVHGMASRLVCSATVVGKADGRFVEIPIEHNRKTSLNVPLLSSAEAEASVNNSAVNGTSKRKRKTAKSKVRTVKHNGVPAARSEKRKKRIIVDDDNGSVPNSKGRRCSRKQRAELDEEDRVDEDSDHANLPSMDTGASSDMEVKEEIMSPDFDNESNCVAEDVDYKITLADGAHSDSDDQALTTETRRVRGERGKSQSTNNLLSREVLHEPTGMNDEVLQLS